MADQLDGSSSIDSRWERHWELAIAWIPYVTLGVSLVLSLTISDHDPASVLLILGLSASAVVWVLTMFTLAKERRLTQWWFRIYFAGLVVLGALLLRHDFFFFVFVITGFIHAYRLRPIPVIFLGVGLSSLVINSGIFLGDRTPENLVIALVVMTIQTGVIGLGIVGGEKLTELSEQRRLTVLDLEAALTENASLQSQLLTHARDSGVSAERQRMAREIHDTIAQGLIGVITQLEAGNRVIHSPTEVRQRMENAERLARDSLEEARRSVSALMPPDLEQRGLGETLATSVERWSELHHVVADLSVTGVAQPLHPEVEVTLLRVAQEALANVAKHSEATQVRVTLSYMEDTVSLDVKDDGKGFDPSSANGGFGLTTMRQRVDALDGTIAVETGNGQGTALSAIVPALTAGER